MNRQLQEQIFRLRKAGMSYEYIRKVLKVTTDQINYAIDTYHDVQNKFPYQLLEDWDRTRLAILRRYGGDKYRDK